MLKMKAQEPVCGADDIYPFKYTTSHICLNKASFFLGCHDHKYRRCAHL